MAYARMVIGEAISENPVKEMQRIYDFDLDFRDEPGFLMSDFMSEDGGNMTVLVTQWKTRDDCLKYHSSRGYRQFVAKTQHLLLGNFVVKLFKVAE